MISEAIVLAGGLGTRLRPVVNNVPKPLASIAGKPFLCWLLEGLAKQRITSAILSTGYMGDVIADTLKSSYAGIKLTYVQEETPLGTGGALWQSLRHSGSERAFVMNGDTWLGINLADMAQQFIDADMVIAARKVDKCARFGGLLCQGDKVIGLKPSGNNAAPAIINAGVYVVRTDLATRYPMPAKFGLEEEVIGNAEKFNIHTFLTDAPFLDIGTPEDFAGAQALIPGWAQ